MPRKQINVSVDPEVYERIQAAAWEDHLTPAARLETLTPV